MALAFGTNAIEFNEPSWTPLSTMGSPTEKYFIDDNNVHITPEGNKVFSILIVSDEPRMIEYKGESIAAKSVAKTVIMNCAIRVFIPVNDMYFNIDKPSSDTIPIASFTYRVNAPELSVPDNSTIYFILCPKAI